MAKYSVGVLLFAAAVFWSSASARPYNPKQQNVIDAITEWVLVEINDVAEPHKTRLANILREAQHQHYDNLMEYMRHMKAVLVQFVQETGIDLSRRKRQVDSESDTLVEIDSEKFPIYFACGIYTRYLIAVAPSEYESALEQKLDELFDRRDSYDNFDEFEQDADDIFERVTGLDIGKIKTELAISEEKRLEFENKLEADFEEVFKKDQ